MWSRVLVLAAVAACYSPRAPSGAPCDPLLDNCPSGLACYAVGGEYRCLAEAPGDDAAVDASDDAALDVDGPPLIDAAVINTTPDAMPTPMTLTYTATVADCVEPDDPDPEECVEANGAMAIDSNDTATSDPWVAFVRFDIDNMPAGKTVTSVKLRMTTTPETKSAASHSGEVWQVQPFTHAMLFATVPAHVGARLAGSQGAVTPSDVVEWPLPATLVTANASVYLGIETPDDDGTVYGDLNTTFPPKLIVVVQ